MKQLMFILVAFIFASCNNVGPEDEVLASDTAQVIIPLEPVPQPVEIPNAIHEQLSHTVSNYYFTRNGMKYMVTAHIYDGGVSTTNLTIDSLRAEWYRSQLKQKR